MVKGVILNDARPVCVECGEGETLLDAFIRSGVHVCADCGGAGLCGKCRAVCSGWLSEPTERERVLLGGALERGVRLACEARILGAFTACAEGDGAFPFSLPPCEGDAADGESRMYLDLGTTTICSVLKQGGGTTVSRGMMNPQRVFGADVISRIDACVKDKASLGIMQRQAAAAVCEMTHGETVCRAAISANTVMSLIFAGISPHSLGTAPYDTPELFGRTLDPTRLGLEGRIKELYITPCIASFIGGDLTASLCYIRSVAAPGSFPALLADLGTNGELALMTDERDFVCSTAAGPCFEGVGIECGTVARGGAVCSVTVRGDMLECETCGGEKPSGICGSGLIDAAAALLDSGRMDNTGRVTTQRVELCEGVYITRRDIRTLQNGKAAVRAGILALCSAAGLSESELKTAYICGSFGGAIKKASAVRTGLLPEVHDYIVSGNTSLLGTMLFSHKPELLERRAREAVFVSLTNNRVFNDAYIEQLRFPNV